MSPHLKVSTEHVKKTEEADETDVNNVVYVM